ncbi:MAG: gliding motility-associated C-terminal domain-containing protein [Bacteroidetes bacterium]|nr:gliding motility-associated C-terminal domain-containing protein [Bacteroidota bacterium]
MTATTKFRAVIKSGVCPIDHSTASTITVDVPSVGGSISSDTTICAGVNSGTLYLSGNTGNVLRWESSDNDFTTVSIVSNATPTLVYSNLTASTKYRAVVKSGACPFTKSNPAIISVDSVSNGGHVTSDITVCLGSNAGTLSLSGNVGSVLYWEQSTDDFATTSPIPNTSNTLVYNDISVPTKYRAVVQSGTCNPANSDSAMISIYPLSVGGQISTSAHACYGNNSGSLTLQNYEGTVQSWEISEDNFANFSTIPNATINQSYSNLVNTTYYRAVVKSGTCPQDISSSAIITVDPTTVPGAVISNTTVCPGSNAGTLALIQHTGSILNWESSTDNFATSNVIANTNIIYNYSSLEDTTWYRASIKSGTCAQAYSTPVKITVLPHALGGEILSDTVVCYGKNLGTLSLKNQRGDLLYWESTTDNFVKSTKLLIYTTTKQYVNLTATTKYRAVLRYGNCPEEKSQPVTVEVDPLFSVNLGADTTICFKKGEWLGSVSNSYPTVLWSNQSTAHNITVKEPGQVWVKVTNNASCSATDTVDLSAYCENVVICFPDVITPNNDAINDNFKPCVEIGGVRSEGSDEVLNENVIFKKFEVHDRWGIKIFESTNKIPKWNGDDLVNSVSAGTFYYYVTFTDMNGVEQEQTGYVTVIK